MFYTVQGSRDTAGAQASTGKGESSIPAEPIYYTSEAVSVLSPRT